MHSFRHGFGLQVLGLGFQAGAKARVQERVARHVLLVLCCNRNCRAPNPRNDEVMLGVWGVHTATRP